ncbi:MAG: MFS transporter [Chloroflexi bacterium]|nr:MFS transporter [Chloroflexota bacterium]
MLRWTWRFRFSGLWLNGDFLKLWAGQSAALVGYIVSAIALPLTAVLTLDATPLQMGVLTAIGGLPSLFIGLFVGAWVDRHRRRPVMVAANWGRAALLMAVPAAALLDALRIELLYFVAFGMGTLSLLFNVSYRSYLPSLVGRERLVEANSKLEVSAAAAELVGPGAAGVLVQLITAPMALMVNAFSFAVSAVSLAFIRTQEKGPAPSEGQASIWKEAVEGLRVVGRHPVLRALAGAEATLSLFNSLLEAVFLIYIARNLEISPLLLGLIFSSGSVGLLAGAFMAGRTTRWAGLGPAIMIGIMVSASGDLILPLAGGPKYLEVALLVMAQLLFGFGLTTYRVSRETLTQALTPNSLLGRVNAVIRVASLGAVPIGALLGGALGETIDLRTTLFIAVAGEFLSVLWLLLSPARVLREQPQAD